jgi:DNA primase
VRLSDEFRASLDSLTTRYQAALSPSGRSYLNGRGLGDEVIERYRLGEVGGHDASHADYTGMLSIPYITRLGGVVSLKFRRAHECTDWCNGHSKYLGPYPTRVYNALAFDQADRLGYIGITEGEFDALVLDGLCDIPAVGIPGVETWKAHREWPELFKGYQRVLVFADDDEPGRGLAKAILHDVDTATVISLPAKDVNQAYMQAGVNTIRKAAGLD